MTENKEGGEEEITLRPLNMEDMKQAKNQVSIVFLLISMNLHLLNKFGLMKIWSVIGQLGYTKYYLISARWGGSISLCH